MFRVDSLATMYLIHPLIKRLPHTRPRVPILMYHSISELRPSSAHAYYDTVTTPRVFADQMRYLAENKYETVSLSEARAYLAMQHVNGRKLVVITFDDGYRDFYTHAYPVLERYGFTATVFLPTAYIRERPQVFNGMDCLTWGQVRELQREGIEFGAHTVTHPQLRGLPEEHIHFEVRASKERIEQELEREVRSFAYPYAFPETDRVFTSKLWTILRQAGYTEGVCTTVGTMDRDDNPLFLRRLPVNRYDGQQLFAAKLEGGYDWLHGAQYVRKWCFGSN